MNPNRECGVSTVSDGVELELREQQERAEVAFAIDQELKAALRRGQAVLWDVAEQCYLFNESRGWLDLGIETLEEYLAQPEIGMSRASFYKFKRTWQSLVVDRKIAADKLRALEMSKVALVAPKIIANKATVEEALADAESLAWGDLRDKYIGERAAISAGETSDRDDSVDPTETGTPKSDVDPTEPPSDPSGEDDETGLTDEEVEDALAGIEFDDDEPEGVSGEVVQETVPPEDDPEYATPDDDEVYDFEVSEDGQTVVFEGILYVKQEIADGAEAADGAEEKIAVGLSQQLGETQSELAAARERIAALEASKSEGDVVPTSVVEELNAKARADAGRIAELESAVEGFRKLQEAKPAEQAPEGKGAETLAAMGGDREEFELAALNEAAKWDWAYIQRSVQANATFPRLPLEIVQGLIAWREKYSV